MNGREPLVRAEGGENEEAKDEENESSGKQVVAVAASMIACMGSMSFGWSQGAEASGVRQVKRSACSRDSGRRGSDVRVRRFHCTG